MGDATDLAHLAIDGDRAGACDERRPNQVATGELVDDGQTEHQSGRRAADVGEVEVHGKRRPRRVHHLYAQDALVAILILAQRDLRDAGRLVLAAEVDRHLLAPVSCSSTAR